MYDYKLKMGMSVPLENIRAQGSRGVRGWVGPV